MNPILKTLTELQQLDSKVAELSAEIEVLPSRVRSLEAELDAFLHTHEEHKHRLTASQKERKELESEIQSIQAKISRHKDQLYQVKTNEQYRAMLKEIEGEEGNIRAIEDQVLEKMIESEELQKKVNEAAARLEGEKSRVRNEIDRLSAARQADAQEKERLLARRKEIEASLDESVLSLYERVRKARRGVALAEVRDDICTACNVRLRPQVNNEVRNSEGLLTCESCGRILYYLGSPPAPPETESEIGSTVGL